jgi:hypothetical protein
MDSRKGHCKRRKGIQASVFHYQVFFTTRQKQFTFLDIGANIGYFSFRIADNFLDATMVAVEGHPRNLKKDLEIAKKNNRDTALAITAFRKRKRLLVDIISSISCSR